MHAKLRLSHQALDCIRHILENCDPPLTQNSFDSFFQIDAEN